MNRPEPSFTQVLRGYDRVEVDRFVAQVEERLAALEAERDAARRRGELAEQHAIATEDENRTLRASARSGPSDDGFGVRAERLMRLAEQEAIDVRAGTAREAAHLLDAARREAELHRQREEQALTGRVAAVERLLGERAAELRERERALADQAHQARAEIDALVDAARAEAGRVRAGAEADADAQRRRAAQDIARMRVAATDELARLTDLRATVLADLERLLALVTGPALRPPPTSPPSNAPPSIPPQAGPPRPALAASGAPRT